MKENHIPKCMSTQHPDNASLPDFSSDPVTLSGKDEVHEAFYAFSELMCDEQMWDIEGKEASRSVVRELLEENPEYFKENILGKDLRLTIRVPNPNYEKVEQKAILEILENIPRSYDTAQAFYESEKAPIFEVIMPMTTSSKDLERVYHYYKEHVSGKGKHRPFDASVEEWVGEIKPDHVNVIPLIEEKEKMLKSHNIVGDFLENKDLNYQRVFLARSDPALNYGLIPAVLINKLALKKLSDLNERIDTEIYPIIGTGSSPFRGNLKPGRIKNSLEEYKSVHTFTIQSAFKYDNPKKDIKEAIKKIKENQKGKPLINNEKRCLRLIEKVSNEYRKNIVKLADPINEISHLVPSRRSRKLHIGLFGYSRKIQQENSDEIKLPRAIKFTASLYSLGIPPEIIGIRTLNDREMDYLMEKAYNKISTDLKDSLRYFNEEALNKYPFLEEDIKKAKEYLDFNVNENHKKITTEILNENNDELKKSKIIEAAKIRKFLG